MNFSISHIKKRIRTSIRNRLYLYRNKKVFSLFQNKIYLNQNKNRFFYGYKVFSETGITPIDAYYSLINLYCSTNGKFNEEVHQKIIIDNPPLTITDTNDDVFGKLNEADFTIGKKHHLMQLNYIISIWTG